MFGYDFTMREDCSAVSVLIECHDLNSQIYLSKTKVYEFSKRTQKLKVTVSQLLPTL